VNIIVCLKQVPGTTDVKIDPETNNLKREGIKNIMNPLDTYALEEGVRIKERSGGKVTVISMGPPPAKDMLREAVSLGADEAILLSDMAFAGADTWATAFTLAAAIKKIGQYGIVLCGRQTFDGDTAQVGPELAEMLGVSLITNVSKIEEMADGQMRVNRMVDEGHAVVQTPLPAVITVTKEINVPRIPSLRSIMKAKNANIQTWTLADLGVDANKVGLNGSYTKVVKIFYPQRTRQATMLKGEMDAQIDTLVEKLKATGLV
jgi:electron transfer flavoprotein beta subunit